MNEQNHWCPFINSTEQNSELVRRDESDENLNRTLLGTFLNMSCALNRELYRPYTRVGVIWSFRPTHRSWFEDLGVLDVGVWDSGISVSPDVSPVDVLLFRLW